jgi:hypothetical protein
MDIKAPVYDGKEPVYKFQKKIDEYLKALKNQKYDYVLNFINLWLDHSKLPQIKSLVDFKKIPEEKLLSDKKANRKLLRKNSEKLMKIFNLNTYVEAETDSDEIRDKYIIQFVSKILRTQDYILVNVTLNDTLYYTIKNKLY